MLLGNQQIRLVLFIGLSILSTFEARAWPPTYGPEFTFTNLEMVEALKKLPYSGQKMANQKFLNLWVEEIRKTCQECKIIEKRDKHGIAYKVEKGSFHYTLSVDTGVLEVQMPGLTLEEIRAQKESIHKEIFQAAEKMGLKPAKTLGGGHIHIGYLEAFKDDPQLFRDFVVDYANHPDLSFGVMGSSLENSPPIVALEKNQQEEFKKLIAEFDHSSMSGEDLAKAIDERVYTKTLKYMSPKHYQAMKMRRVYDEIFQNQKTVEMRAVRPQQSVEQYLVELELLEERLKYLKRWKGRLPLDLPIELAKEPIDKLTNFYIYVREMGYSWEKAKLVLPEELLGLEPNYHLGDRVVKARHEQLAKLEKESVNFRAPLDCKDFYKKI
ncbi:MAG: hypothetical protein M9962_11050 [Oligoflexia bacterium]|nr:hypothetical protein [Oligoflexia bacterium]